MSLAIFLKRLLGPRPREPFVFKLTPEYLKDVDENEARAINRLYDARQMMDEFAKKQGWAL